MFYSYSPKDEQLVNELEEHLAIQKRQGLIQTWNRKNILAGDDVASKVNSHLDEADVIVLLISSSYIDSDYCYSIEMMLAMVRHRAGKACVIPILLRPCDVTGAPFAQLKSLPSDQRAITAWSDHDAAWASVAADLRTRIESLRVDEDFLRRRQSRGRTPNMERLRLLAERKLAIHRRLLEARATQDSDPIQDELRATRELRRHAEPTKGDLLGRGRYELQELIGCGGFGNVWKAWDLSDGNVVAIKVLQGRYMSDATMAERLLRGFHCLLGVEHPNIVRVHGMENIPEDEPPFFAMEYVVGGSLEAATKKRDLSHRDIFDIVCQVGEALDHLHRQSPPILHLDVKPSNVLLAPRDPPETGFTAKLADFDLAWRDDPALFTRTRRGGGTSAFMAPELEREDAQPDARSDLFSLAATAVYAISHGKHRLNRYEPTQSAVERLDTPSPVKSALKQALSIDPQRRHGGTLEFCTALKRALEIREVKPENARAAPNAASIKIAIPQPSWAPTANPRPTMQTDEDHSTNDSNFRFLGMLGLFTIVVVAPIALLFTIFV